MTLSSIYQDGVAWAVAYEDGVGNYELLDEIFTTSRKAEIYARSRKPESFVNGKLYVVKLELQTIHRTVEGKK